MIYHTIKNNLFVKDTYTNQACDDSQTKH